MFHYGNCREECRIKQLELNVPLRSSPNKHKAILTERAFQETTHFGRSGISAHQQPNVTMLQYVACPKFLKQQQKATQTSRDHHEALYASSSGVVCHTFRVQSSKVTCLGKKQMMAFWWLTSMWSTWKQLEAYCFPACLFFLNQQDGSWCVMVFFLEMMQNVLWMKPDNSVASHHHFLFYPRTAVRLKKVPNTCPPTTFPGWNWLKDLLSLVDILLHHFCGSSWLASSSNLSLTHRAKNGYPPCSRENGLVKLLAILFYP